MKGRIIHLAIGAALGLAGAACTPGDTSDQTNAAAVQETRAVAENVDPMGPTLPLAVSINEVMVALVDFAADGVWRPAASETPLDDRQWLLAEQDAINLIASASLITMAGTGDNDAQWTPQADWRQWSTDMQAMAQQARAAIEAKDQEALRLAGDRLVEVCQACHQQYKPGLPSMGVTRFPIYPKRDGTLTPP